MPKHMQLNTAPVEVDSTGAKPEWGRWQEVQRLFGIGRGTAYNLLADGKIRGCVLRSRGSKSGMRLFDLDSVREYIHSQMENGETGKETGETLTAA